MRFLKQNFLFLAVICLLILLIAGAKSFFNQNLHPQAEEILKVARRIEQSIDKAEGSLYAPEPYGSANRFLERAETAFKQEKYVNALGFGNKCIEKFNESIQKIQLQTSKKIRLGFDELLIKGKEYLEKGNYDVASEYFSLALKLKPNNVELNKKIELVSRANTAHEDTGEYSEMIYIPAGEFIMGSNHGDADERPRHKVYLNGYYIDKYEVTFNQYDKFCEDTGRKKPDDNGWGRGERPVVNVSWEDADAYAGWAGKRLPTEAEWEKAARAGSSSEFCFGNTESKLGEYAWYKSNSEAVTHPVGQKKPNKWGIYDIYGNAWEWCSDWYDRDYYKNSQYKNPQGPDSGIVRSVRGGSWMDFVERHPYSYVSRSANRYADIPKAKHADYGFRCVKDCAP